MRTSRNVFGTIREFKTRQGWLTVMRLRGEEGHPRSWAAQMERREGSSANLNGRSYDADPRGQGNTLREAFSRLRMELAIEKNPNIRKVNGMLKSKTLSEWAAEDTNKRLSQEPW